MGGDHITINAVHKLILYDSNAVITEIGCKQTGSIGYNRCPAYASKTPTMTAKITLIQEDINLLQVDAIVSITYLEGSQDQNSAVQATDGMWVEMAKTTPDDPWVAGTVVKLKLPSEVKSLDDISAEIYSGYCQALSSAAASELRSIALGVIGHHSQADNNGLSTVHLCQLAITAVNEASIQYDSLRKIIICARNEQEYACLVEALQGEQLH